MDYIDMSYRISSTSNIPNVKIARYYWLKFNMSNGKLKLWTHGWTRIHRNFSPPHPGLSSLIPWDVSRTHFSIYYLKLTLRPYVLMTYECQPIVALQVDSSRFTLSNLAYYSTTQLGFRGARMEVRRLTVTVVSLLVCTNTCFKVVIIMCISTKGFVVFLHTKVYYTCP